MAGTRGLARRPTGGPALIRLRWLILLTLAPAFTAAVGETRDPPLCVERTSSCPAMSKMVVMLRWIKQVRLPSWATCPAGGVSGLLPAPLYPRIHNKYYRYMQISIRSDAVFMYYHQRLPAASMLASRLTHLQLTHQPVPPHQAQFAGFYAAEELGFYRDNCLDVTLVHRESVNYSPVQEVRAPGAYIIVPLARRVACAAAYSFAVYGGGINEYIYLF